MVIKGLENKIVKGIILVLLLLSVCVSIDYAEEDTITNVNDTSGLSVLSDKNVTFVNGSYYVLPEDSGIAKSDGKVYSDKLVKEKVSDAKKKPTITVYGYPTCYTCWKTQRYRCVKRTYINYCPNCRRYGTLRNNPKGVRDGEITCRRCDCDFCDFCGRDKVGSSGRHNWNILVKA